jgi:prepilin-type N-terminal cleavage/methylation domain-containing protein
MIKRADQAGFTVVELLITLFVAAGFLVSGYQLYNLIIKDSGSARADSKASSVAYDYMRRYSASVVSPCVASTPLNNSSISVGSLSNVTITVNISCPYAATTTVSKVDVLIQYNTPQQSQEYATYVSL